MIKVGSDFSGVGAFNQALIRLGIEYDEVFACDMDKYARQTFIHNYGEPKYYPTNVYDREIPSEPLDIYMTSPPCQAFSLAGKRLGKEDKRGILFFNSHEFIQKNKPRYFIFENVKGLLSDNGGKTFSEWVNLLGGKSINGNPVIFPYEDAVPYHLYWKVLNAKHHGVPQNRERVFLIGIRDDEDNNFRFPIEEQLTKKLKDILEDSVDEKYFLSEKMVEWISNHRDKRDSQNNFPMDENDIGSCVTARYFKMGAEDPYIKVSKEVRTEESKQKRKKTGTNDFRGKEIEFREQEYMNTITTSITNDHFIKIGDYRTDEGFRWREDDNSPAIMAMMRDTWKQNFTGQNPPIIKYNDKRLNETIEKNELPSGEVKAIDTYNKKIQDNSPTLTEPHHNTTRLWDGYKIRRLTPRECFRLMDFPDTFTWPVSDSQAYKQAGNSIVVGVLTKILSILLC